MSERDWTDVAIDGLFSRVENDDYDREVHLKILVATALRQARINALEEAAKAASAYIRRMYNDHHTRYEDEVAIELRALIERRRLRGP